MVHGFTSFRFLLQSHLLLELLPETILIIATPTPDAPYLCPCFGLVLSADRPPTYFMFMCVCSVCPLRKNLHGGRNSCLCLSLCRGQCLAGAHTVFLNESSGPGSLFIPSHPTSNSSALSVGSLFKMDPEEDEFLPPPLSPTCSKPQHGSPGCSQSISSWASCLHSCLWPVSSQNSTRGSC